MTKASPMRQTAKHLEDDSKGARLRAWLGLKSRRGYDTTTKTTNMATQTSPACNSSDTPSSGQTQVFQPVSCDTGTTLDIFTPPAYDYQGALAPLYAGLPREDELRIMEVVDPIMEKVQSRLSSRYDLPALIGITAAIREGCICAAATVCKVALEKPVTELNEILNEGCQKVGRAVIAATAAAPERKWIGVASGTAKCISLAASHHVEYNKKHANPYAASAQLEYTA